LFQPNNLKKKEKLELVPTHLSHVIEPRFCPFDAIHLKGV